MELTQKEIAESYLQQNYYEGMRGADLARQLDIPFRSARRYVRQYRDSLSKADTFTPALRVLPCELKGVVFDIETTDFGTEGYAGHLVCCSFVELHSGNVETLEIKYTDGRNDERLLREVAKKLSKYSLHVGHNIAAYDYNWLNTRLQSYRLPTLDSAWYIDTYQVAKSMAIKTSKSLGNLIDFFGLKGVKTSIYRTSWSMVDSPHETEFDDALDEIMEHCEFDVLANRELLHQIILPYALNSIRTNPIKASKFSGDFWKYQE